MFSKKYRERYNHALKLQRWPLVDTRKMEIENIKGTILKKEFYDHKRSSITFI